MPLLTDAKVKYAESAYSKDRRYYVPAKGRTKFAKRNDYELKNIYDRFLQRGLYESFIVNAVSQFESFLMDVLIDILLEHPRKLGITVPGISACKQISTEILFEASTLDEATRRVVEDFISGIFYSSPRSYIDYLSKASGVEITDPAFDEYIELKATRDLIVHNTGRINATYITKAGRHARGAIGDDVLIDEEYFEHCLATLKRCAGIIKRDVEKTFPRA